MEISSEARLPTFSIGATSLLGRATTLRLLLGYKMSRIFSGLHPLLRLQNSAQAILIGIAVLAFLVKRFPRMRTRAKFACRRKFWGNTMRGAVTYEEWAHAAMMVEKDVGRVDENDSTSPLYDEELVRAKLGELRSRREEGDMRDVAFSLRADLDRNLGNMCNPRIHKGRLQVPKLIKDYIDEVSTQLKMICDCQDLLLEEKLAFMHEIRHAYGRTALLLSGGSSLGTFHVGVVKTLIEHKLLPRVIAGSSVGSIMCSIIATRSWTELESFFENSSSSMQFFDQMGGILATFKRIMTLGAVHDITQLQRTLRHLTSNLTFQEAYDMTGRVLGITVCSPRKHEPPRCLNYLTSPNVVIWSAVTASCAFPGLFEAQELMAKDRFGEIVPFHVPFMDGPEEMNGRSARRWRDGSLEVDLPMMQLKELFNVNHFIVSQANPHIAPLLRVKELVSAYGGNFGAKLAHLVEMEVKHRCNQFLELGCPLGGIAKLFAQDWEGDVTVVMPATLAQYSKLLQNPSYMELQKAVNQGRRCTWEKLSAIKANCSIEITLDECVTLLNHMRRLKRNATRAAAAAASHMVKVNPSRRIPSWNRLARGNSTSSIEDGFLSNTSSLHQMTTSQRARHPQSVHHGSDSDSESIDLHCWTRSGGTLTRTDSATKFIQDLEIEQKEDEIDGSPSMKSSSSSIVVAEGDLLQPEMIQNGIVLNIVKSADLNARNRVEISENFEGSQPEEVVDNVQMESCNGEDDEAESRSNDRFVDARNEASY